MNSFYEKVEAGEFPTGMKVLVVDGDQDSLAWEENVLSQLTYDVKTCTKGKDALKILREKKRSLDLVFVDTNIPDMDSRSLCKHIKDETNLATIMMFPDDGENVSSIMRSIENGASGFLIKPVNRDQVNNIWHHAARKRYRKKLKLERRSSKIRANASSSNGEIEETGKSSEDDRTNAAMAAEKRPRFLWSEERKRKFESAANLIGLANATPLNILKAMNDSEITRDQVASHLQKYRLKLKRIEQSEANDRQIDPTMNMQSNSPQLNGDIDSGYSYVSMNGHDIPSTTYGSDVNLPPSNLSQSNGDIDQRYIHPSTNIGYDIPSTSYATNLNHLPSNFTQTNGDINSQYIHVSMNGHDIPSTIYGYNFNLPPLILSRSNGDVDRQYIHASTNNGHDISSTIFGYNFNLPPLFLSRSIDDVHQRYTHAGINGHDIPYSNFEFRNSMPTHRVSDGDVNTISPLNGQPGINGDANALGHQSSFEYPGFVGVAKAEDSAVFQASAITELPQQSNQGTETLNPVKVETNEEQGLMKDTSDKDKWMEESFDFDAYLNSYISFSPSESIS